MRLSERKLEQSRYDYDRLQDKYNKLNKAYDRIYTEAAQLKERAGRLEKELADIRAAISRMPEEIQSGIKDIVKGIKETEIMQKAREAAKDMGQHMHIR